MLIIEILYLLVVHPLRLFSLVRRFSDSLIAHLPLSMCMCDPSSPIRLRYLGAARQRQCLSHEGSGKHKAKAVS